VDRYRVEPYVIVADIYSAAGHVGRGGWTWYTGAAGWTYRIVLEHLLGIRREGSYLRVAPCVPAAWPGYQVTMRISGSEYVIRIDNPERTGRGVRSLMLDGRVVEDGRIRIEPHSGRHVVDVVLGSVSAVSAR
jgi:cyclic beta-1,2-glucan synthetase